MTSLHPPARRVAEIELQPDWILLGYPQGDGTFTVYGSIELDRAALEIQHRFDFRNFKTIAAPLRPDFTVRLSATMKRYAVANGETYAAALALLFREWDADEQRGGSPLSERRAIGGPG
jgi:hypothetical protein